MVETQNETSPKTPPRRLYRSESDRLLAGVAGGMGEYFEVDPTLIRITLVVLTFFGGLGIILYLICWLVIPTQSDPKRTLKDNIETGAEELRKKAESLAEDFRHRRFQNSEQDRRTWGFALIILGLVFLLANIGLFSVNLVGKLWPLILILIGWKVLAKRRK